MSNESLSKALVDKTLARIMHKYELHEELSDDGPYMTLTNQIPNMEGTIGSVRKYVGEPLFQVVTCSIVVPQIGLDSHMLYVFMPSESAVPHFTVDSVHTGETYAMHLDLTPRVDIGSRLTYMDEVFTPLTEQYKTAYALEGLTPAELDPRQYAIMSPWMVVTRADEKSFIQLTETVNFYLDHWFTLVEKGISAEAIEGIGKDYLVARDKRSKSIIFNPAVDKVWSQISGLIGEEVGKELRNLLRATSA